MENIFSTNHYENLLDNIKENKYDFIIIDGPWGTPTHSRNQILEIAQKNLLAKNFVILMDDYIRKGEKQTINELYNLMQTNNIHYVSGVYSGKKDSIVICSPTYKCKRPADCAKTDLKKQIILERSIIGILKTKFSIPFFLNKRTPQKNK